MKIRIALLILSMSFAAFSALRRGVVEAALDMWEIYPGIQESGTVYEYGWHFDEAASLWYGARDFNHANDESSISAWLQAKALRNLPWPTRYWVAAGVGGCNAIADPQINIFGTWYTYSADTLHYWHTKSINGGGTGEMLYTNDTISKAIGTIAPAYDDCQPGPYAHLHQSAFLGTYTDNYQTTFSTDTCWIDTDSGQCPLDDYDDDQGCGYNAPNVGNYTKSGTIAEYVCQSWSYRTYSTGTSVFGVRY